MNRKTGDKESSGKTGPEQPRNRVVSDAGRYLEYENIPDPISFKESRPSRNPSNNNKEESGEEDIPGGRH